MTYDRRSGICHFLTKDRSRYSGILNRFTFQNFLLVCLLFCCFVRVFTFLLHRSLTIVSDRIIQVKMEGLEFVFRLKWRNSSNSGTSVVGIYDTPPATNSLELFKSTLFRNIEGVDLDAAELRVAMQVNRTNEWVLDSQPEFERALLAFRHQASKEEVIVINVYDKGNRSVQSKTANDTEIMGRAECKEPPQWFLNFMQRFRQELIEEVSNVVKENAGMKELCANKSAPLFSSNITVENQEVEEPDVGKTEGCRPQKERKPVENILDLPSEMLLNIFQQLDLESISKCAQVCKKFSDLSKNSELFQDVEFDSRMSQKCAKWLLDRATNPRKLCVVGEEFSDLIAQKLGTCHSLDHLSLVYLDLRYVVEGSLNNLNSFSLFSCQINCETFGHLLRHNKVIREVTVSSNVCSHCDGVCNRGILPLLNSKHCAGLKVLSVWDNKPAPNRAEAMLAMELVARQCTKLENVSFGQLDFMTDDILEVLFTNCTQLRVLQLLYLPNISVKSCLMAIDLLPQLQIIGVYSCPLVTKCSEVQLRDAIARLKHLSSTRTSPTLDFES